MKEDCIEIYLRQNKFVQPERGKTRAKINPRNQKPNIVAKKTPNICPPDKPRELAILTGKKKISSAMTKTIRTHQKFAGVVFQIS